MSALVRGSIDQRGRLLRNLTGRELERAAFADLPDNLTETVVDDVVVLDHVEEWLTLPEPQTCAMFTDHRWFSCLRDVYGLEVRSKVIRSARGFDAALAYCVIDDARGQRMVSLPFCDFVDSPLTEPQWELLSAELLATELPIRIETPAAHPARNDQRLVTSTDGVHHRIVVDRDPDGLIAGYATLPRRMIRRAEREGISYYPTTDRRDLADFHRLHVGVRKYRHGLLAQPFELFESIAERFFDTGSGVIIKGEHDGQMVGGCLLLQTNDAFHYKFSVSAPDYRRLGVSHGAVHAAVEHTAQAGMSVLDLGRSDFADDGLVDFKRRFRPIEVLLTRHDRGLLEANDFAHTLSDLTAAFVRPSVPDDVTAAAGALLYRFFA